MEGTPCQSKWMPEGNCDPMGTLCWSRLFLKDCTSWEGPTVGQFRKSCILGEGLTLENFVENCLL